MWCLYFIASAADSPTLRAMATLSFTPPPSSSLSCLSSFLPPPPSHFPILSCCFLSSSHSLSKSPSSSKPVSSSPLIWSTFPNKPKPTSFSTLALVDQQEPLVDEQQPLEAADPIEDGRNRLLSGNNNKPLKPCELDVCNLPRSCGITEIQDLFKPYGTVQSVEVSRNPETGISRGCGTVTMSSIGEAKAAMTALDGSDIGGREMRVKFKNLQPFKSKPNSSQMYEAPYRIYVGNLPWQTKPEELKSHFSKFGTVNSAKILYDKKNGKSRCYGFLSFSSAAERNAALSLGGTEFLGRTILVREVEQKIERKIEP